MRASLVLALLASACGGQSTATVGPLPSTADAAAGGPAPTYGALFDGYFAVGTPGHCAKAGCHGDPGHHFWLCGPNKNDCYAAMVKAGLIDTAHPGASVIADPGNSPIRWINPNGAMPFDGAGANPAGRDAIVAWVAAGARND